MHINQWFLVVIIGTPGTLFSPSSKNEINSLEKKFLYFVKKIFSYILQNRTC